MWLVGTLRAPQPFRSRNKMKALATICIATLLIAGCRSAGTEISRDNLEQAFILNSSRTFIGYYYLGTDDAHHHFVARWQYQPDRYFYILKDHLPVSVEHPISDKGIELFLVATTNLPLNEFCKIGNNKIYITK